MQRNMKLLVLTSNPYRASFRQRIGVYLDILKEKGLTTEVAVLPKNFSARRQLYKQASDFDGVLIHKKLLNFWDARILRKSAKKIIYNYDDAVMLSEKHPEKKSLSHLLPFRRIIKLSDMVITGSRYLAQFAGSNNEKVKILPIGLKTSDYDFDPPKQDEKIRLGWIGSGNTLPFLEDLRDVLEQIGQKFDNCVLRIIGDDFFDLSNMPVEKIKWQQDTRGVKLAECDIGLAPLPDNPFTQGKCSFKVLEYSASGLAVVASPVGTNPDHLVEGQSGFLAKSHQDWIEKISILVKDADLRKQMGQKGKQIAQNHDTAIIGDRMSKLITNCLNGQR
ncbi:MAG: glycosyltransferase family 4 protein [Phycisphaerae bacterium]|nr:glycosyltransferase family 4 protein [Phycisphaerae bacterium]